MWDADEIGRRVRFLPAAWVPELVIDQLASALLETSSSRRTDHLSASLLRLARSELLRHRGSPGEPCFITREAVFGASALLDEAGSRLAARRRQAGALVAFAVRDHLIEAITEVQPVAPS